jgi:hypothetical protein
MVKFETYRPPAREEKEKVQRKSSRRLSISYSTEDIASYELSPGKDTDKQIQVMATDVRQGTASSTYNIPRYETLIL